MMTVLVMFFGMVLGWIQRDMRWIEVSSESSESKQKMEVSAEVKMMSFLSPALSLGSA